MTDKEAIEHAIKTLTEMVETTDDTVVALTASVAIVRLTDALQILDSLHSYIRRRDELQIKWFDMGLL